MVRRVLALLLVLAAAAGAEAARRAPPVQLPSSAPLPPQKPEIAAESRQGIPGVDAVPVPEPRPAAPGEAESASVAAAPDAPLEAETGETPAVAPEPEPRPYLQNPAAAEAKPAPPANDPVPPAATEPSPAAQARQPVPAEVDKPAAETPQSPSYQPDTRSTQRAEVFLPPEEVACRTRLAELGVDFEARKEEHDQAGCALPYPLSVKRLGKDLSLQPPALMNCAMAEAAARFMRDVVQPAAQVQYEEEVATVAQASAYVCRPRNGTTKLSEHAFGNALDIASFVLTGGTRIEIGISQGDKAEAFQSQVRKAACGPFKTVLGPGSDADHATHFHLDLAPRKHGGTFCQ
jgi:hypothetical protein